MQNKRGFLLFEVVVSVAVISVCLLFIARAYGTCKKSMKASHDMIEARLLLERKMWDIENKGLSQNIMNGVFENNDKYCWRVEAMPLENSNISFIKLEVFQESNPDKTRYSVITYLGDRT